MWRSGGVKTTGKKLANFPLPEELKVEKCCDYEGSDAMGIT